MSDASLVTLDHTGHTHHTTPKYPIFGHLGVVIVVRR